MNSRKKQSNTDQNVFVLGVGCQKGGSSWLNSYLRRHSCSKLGMAKEYHVFDEIYKQYETYNYLGVDESTKPRLSRFREKCFTNPDEYFEYFLGLLQRSGKKLTADITPSYAMLPIEAFAHIKDGFAKKGIAVKVIYIMRDPFERIYSHCKKVIRNNNPDNIGDSSIEAQILLNQHSNRKFQAHTRYDLTIKNLEEVFDKENIYYGFYETLFCDKSIKKITKFLGIPFEKGAYNVFKNKGQPSAIVSTTKYAKMIAEYYTDTYLFLYDKFGKRLIRRIWKSAKYID
jgi:hypothetical protein